MPGKNDTNASRLIKFRNLELFELYASAAKEVYVRLFDQRETLMETKRALEGYIDKLIDGIDENNRAVFEILATVEFGNRFVSHSLKTTIMSIIIGKQLRFPEGKLFAVGSAAFLHDIGKAKSDNPFLNSYFGAIDDPQDLENNHPIIGASIVAEYLGYGSDIAQGVRNHHEQLDGSGFPRGLNAGSISLLDRVVFTANFIDNLLYRTDYSGIETVSMAIRHAFDRFPAKFDPDIKAVLLAFTEKPSISKRRFERTVITLAANYRRWDSGGNYSCRILDISGSGARIRCKDTMVTGTMLYLNFALSNVMTFNDIVCKVVRRIPDESGYVYGLDFEDKSGAIQQKIDRYVQRYVINQR
ncbi:MAG TPA: PilZ domain-containing protein [Spirochaetota bacterium]|mgnify:FL=1|nr:PilZ domain-containing protein [Spirochaetota bacterium]